VELIGGKRGQGEKNQKEKKKQKTCFYRLISNGVLIYRHSGKIKQKPTSPVCSACGFPTTYHG